MYGETAMTKFEEFENVIARLRAPDGCPWDRAQTHMSLKNDQTGDADNLKEELGDLLMQVVIHARIAEEEGLFTMDDVIQSIIDKMVRRHPHVFGDSDGPGTDGSQASWDEIKRQEKQGKEWTEEYLPDAFEEAKELIEAAKKRKGFDTKKAE